MSNVTCLLLKLACMVLKSHMLTLESLMCLLMDETNSFRKSQISVVNICFIGVRLYASGFPEPPRPVVVWIELICWGERLRSHRLPCALDCCGLPHALMHSGGLSECSGVW